MQRICLILLLLLVFSACSAINRVFSGKKDFRLVDELEKVDKGRDYVDHLASLGRDYLSSPGIQKIKIDSKSMDYLDSIYKRIVYNNELLLNKEMKPKFYFIKDKTPFYFSLPQGQFYFSTGLFLRYVQSEQILASLLTFEIIKTHRNLYEKKMVVPIGYLSTEKMLSLTRLPLEMRMEVNKWAYFATKRAEFDASAYLIWLQTQNKNVLDFSMQKGDTTSASREEFLFKRFMVSQGLEENINMEEQNSSKGFYLLKRDMQKEVI